jgi:hypothetical protein
MGDLLSGSRKDDFDDGILPQPWHVPQVPEDALDRELPGELAEAARRALEARRPGVRVADLVQHGSRSEDGSGEYVFSDGNVSIALRIFRVDAGVRLHIACLALPHARVEVMHGADTVLLELDEAGAAEVPVAAGLISVLINGRSGPPSPVQTSWLPVG